MEDVVNAFHCGLEGTLVADIAYVKFNFVRYFGHLGLIFVAHIVLLLFVAREDSDFAYVGAKEAVEYGVTEGTCSPGDHQCFVFKNAHIVTVL